MLLSEFIREVTRLLESAEYALYNNILGSGDSGKVSRPSYGIVRRKDMRGDDLHHTGIGLFPGDPRVYYKYGLMHEAPGSHILFIAHHLEGDDYLFTFFRYTNPVAGLQKHTVNYFQYHSSIKISGNKVSFYYMEDNEYLIERMQVDMPARDKLRCDIMCSEDCLIGTLDLDICPDILLNVST